MKPPPKFSLTTLLALLPVSAGCTQEPHSNRPSAADQCLGRRIECVAVTH
jgi:hypothetical protein